MATAVLAAAAAQRRAVAADPAAAVVLAAVAVVLAAVAAAVDSVAVGEEGGVDTGVVAEADINCNVLYTTALCALERDSIKCICIRIRASCGYLNALIFQVQGDSSCTTTYVSQYYNINNHGSN